MLGSIIGDVAGSRFEFSNWEEGDFELLDKGCCFTDDTVMTCAVADALLSAKDRPEVLTEELIRSMQAFGHRYPACGFGARFIGWIFDVDPQPYGSLGNGAAMRVSPVSDLAESLEEAEFLAEETARVSHDHPEGIKSAKAAATAGYMAKTGSTMEEIRAFLTERYYPEIADMHVADLLKTYRREIGNTRRREWAPYSVPQALVCFLESTSFEDAVRNCILIGGDCDTTAAVAGGVAELYYGIPDGLRLKVLEFLPEPLLRPLERWFTKEALHAK